MCLAGCMTMKTNICMHIYILKYLGDGVAKINVKRVKPATHLHKRITIALGATSFLVGFESRKLPYFSVRHSVLTAFRIWDDPRRAFRTALPRRAPIVPGQRPTAGVPGSAWLLTRVCQEAVGDQTTARRQTSEVNGTNSVTLRRETDERAAAVAASERQMTRMRWRPTPAADSGAARDAPAATVRIGGEKVRARAVPGVGREGRPRVSVTTAPERGRSVPKGRRDVRARGGWRATEVWPSRWVWAGGADDGGETSIAPPSEFRRRRRSVFQEETFRVTPPKNAAAAAASR